MRLIIAVMGFVIAFHLAHAVDHPAWLQGAKAPDGTHCCGPTDCVMVLDSLVRFDGPNVVLPSQFGELVYPRKDLQPSPDGNWWVCRGGGKNKARCAFKPKPPGV